MGRLLSPRSSQELDPSAVLAKAALAAAARLGLRHKQLAEIIGTSEASVSRLKNDRGLDPERKEGELALLFLRVYRSLDALVGGNDVKARDWLHATNDHVGGIHSQHKVILNNQHDGFFGWRKTHRSLLVNTQ